MQCVYLWNLLWMINYCVFECMTLCIIDFGNTSKTYYSCLSLNVPNVLWFFLNPLSYVQLEFCTLKQVCCIFVHFFFQGLFNIYQNDGPVHFFYLLQNIYLPSNWIYRINIRPSQLLNKKKLIAQSEHAIE
jgi:hypothetical protein